MNRMTILLATIALGAVCTTAFVAPAVADDTEVFFNTPTVGNSSQPNILFIIDDSGSMGQLISTQANYDPATTYAGGCSKTNVYWIKDTGTPPPCTTLQFFNKTSLFCRAGLNGLAATGLYTGQMAQYNDTSNKKNWDTLDATQKIRPVECKADNGIDGGPNTPTINIYPRDGVTVATDAWTSSTNNQGGFVWGKKNRTDGTYTLYDGNYLNWLTSATVLMPKIDIVKNVATNMLSTLSGVNVGLITFNLDQGGYVMLPLQDIATSRASMIAAVNTLTAHTFTPLSETLYEAALYYMGRPVYYGTTTYGPGSVASSRNPSNLANYQSPLVADCQKSFIVYLTDGEPTFDVDADAKIKSLVDAKGQTFASFNGGSATCDVEVYPPGFTPSGGDCLDELAQFLYHGDLSTLPDQQNVITYTIGFTVNLPILSDTAARGGGAYYTANDMASLSTAFANIVTNILDTQTTFVSPTVAVNSFNRTQNLNDLFISLFQPTASVHWPGNLKKYRLRPSDGAIMDATVHAGDPTQVGYPAIDPVTGFFRTTAQSYWSPLVDGDDVTAGGAANQIPAVGTRKVFTYLGSNAALTDPTNRIDKTNVLITNALLGTGQPGDPTRDQLIDFINNLDVADHDRNGITAERRDQMGDPLHSQPQTLIYGPALTNQVVFVATNDGFLHAIDAATGVEKWAFILPDFLTTQKALFLDSATAAKNYGADGSLSLQTVADNDGTINAAAGEKVYLFFGLRRGGDAYYGLDVTNPDAPVFMWKKDGTSLTGIGESWSTPVPTRMSISGVAQNAQKLVLVIGGGYEPDQDLVTASTDTIGNSIYIVDSVTGALLWRGTKTGGDKSFNVAGKAMDYSIPADIKVIDFDGDGYADRMYAADMGGQVWRFDVNNGQSSANLITGGVIAQLGAASLTAPAPQSATRRFYYAPDVALVNDRQFNFIHVGIGSGHRAHPLSLVNQDRYYALRDYNGIGKLDQPAYDLITPIKDADLVDVTDNLNASVPQKTAAGWRFELRDGGWIGEKVLAETSTFNNVVHFTTFRPSADTVSCKPQIGVSRVYLMSVFNGAPVRNLDGSTDNGPLTASDRYQEFAGSIASKVVFIFPSGEPGCVGDQCAPPPVACVDLFCFGTGFANAPVRTFWSEASAD